jgi:hypothetical protein
MDEPDRQRSWYQRPILPPWFPAWLVACLAAGAITCVAFHFGLGGLSGRGLAYCFGGGFVFALLILSLAAGRASPTEPPSELAPPHWVCPPVIAVALMGAWVELQFRAPAPPANMPPPDYAV